jgi:hypothetical protein
VPSTCQCSNMPAACNCRCSACSHLTLLWWIICRMLDLIVVSVVVKLATGSAMLHMKLNQKSKPGESTTESCYMVLVFVTMKLLAQRRWSASVHALQGPSGHSLGTELLSRQSVQIGYIVMDLSRQSLITTYTAH